MKFSATSMLSALVFIASAKADDATRCETGRTTVTNLNDNYQPWIKQLYAPCVTAPYGRKSDFWSRRACLAGAIAMGPRGLVNYASCDKPSIQAQEKLGDLDYGAFASIVGDCAYDANACGITRQNLVDLVYGELDAAKATVWSANADELKTDVIEPVFTWAAQPSITYSRFNEWLHLADYPAINTGSPSGKEYFYDHESDSV